MLVIKPIGLGGGDEELAGVGVLAGIGHAQHARLIMSMQKVLIRKSCSVDALLSRAISLDEIPTLDHEILHNPMECTSLVSRGLLVHKELPRAQLTKVLTRLGALYTDKRSVLFKKKEDRCG